MRALTAVLVLLAGGWSQITALDCPMPRLWSQASSAVDAHAHASGHGEPTHDESSRDAPSPDERSRDGSSDHGHSTSASAPASADSGAVPSPHSSADCRLLMSCGTAVLAASGATSSAGAWSRASAELSATRAHTAVFPGQDPPPPRLPV